MSKINEGTSWNIVSVMPRVGVLVLVRLLDPLEDLEERLELDLTVRQVHTFKTVFSSFVPTFNLNKYTRSLAE